MILTVLPSDIIKLCLFNKYKRFLLKDKTKEEIDKWIIEDKPEIITDEDAYVIGLLKVIETDNLIHRFNQTIEDFLKIKSIINQDRVVINKASLLKEIMDFKDMFPDAFTPNKKYYESIQQLKSNITFFYDDIEKLTTLQILSKDNKLYTVVSSNDVQKLIKKNFNRM